MLLMPTDTEAALAQLLALEVPADRIALDPAPERDAARLMVVDRAKGTLRHTWIRNLPAYVLPGDVWVINVSAVAPVLTWLRTASGARAELLWVAQQAPRRWRVFGQTSKLRLGEEWVGPGGLRTRVAMRERQFAELEVLNPPPTAMAAWFAQHGAMPLPPYIRKARMRQGRSATDDRDRERYQTVYAAAVGSIAAPTAGLHFTPALLESIQSVGAQIVPVVLHVGPGTFAHLDPGQDPAAVAVAPEVAQIPADTAASVATAKQAGQRVVAVGSTSLRALEDLWRGPEAAAGEVDITLAPGRPPRVADALLTNFHLPHTSLRLMVAAVAGTALALAAYREALAAGYRFYSYGDAMLII